MPRPIICVDFDGTIHSYDRGWQDGVIYGEVLPGFFEWLMQAKDHFVVAVYSSRSRTEDGYRAMHDWLRVRYRRWLEGLSAETRASLLGERVSPSLDDLLIFLHEKPAAHLTIDDRAIQFRGQWNVPELDPLALIHFKPWNQR